MIIWRTSSIPELKELDPVERKLLIQESSKRLRRTFIFILIVGFGIASVIPNDYINLESNWIVDVGIRLLIELPIFILIVAPTFNYLDSKTKCINFKQPIPF
jgi:hypothetical protein